MSSYTAIRRSSALLAASGLLLLAACNNQSPAPPAKPGQPLTWAQQHELDKQAYQQINLDRFQN